MAKKLLAMLLALVLVISLVACGNANAPKETEAPKADAPAKETEAPKQDTPAETEAPQVDPADVEFTVMMKADIEDANEMPIIQLFEERTGYKPDYIEVSSAAFSEQKQLMWLDDELPDVIVGVGRAEWSQPAIDGRIVDLAPYLKDAELMPNFNKSMDPEQWAAISDSEGHVYAFPRLINNRLDKGLNINVEWLDKVGLDKPETPDELLEVWRAFKTQDPNGNGEADEIPFSSELIWNNAMSTLDPMFGMFGTIGGWQADENGKVFFGPTSENYKEGLKWFRQAYSEGLIDQEIFTQDMKSFTAKGQTNPPTYGMTLSYTWGAQNRVHTPETVVQYDYLLPMKADDGVRYWQNSGTYSVTNSNTTVITSDCDCIEDVCRWIDAMYDPYVGYQIDQAPLGYGFAILEDGTWKSGSSACPDADFGDYADWGTWRAALHSNEFPRILDTYAKEAWGVKTDKPSFTTEVFNTQDALYRENCTLAPYCGMDGANEEEAEVEATYVAEFDNYWRNQCASWITGNGDIDAEWDDFQQGLIDMGLEEIAASYQSRYDRIH